MEFLHPAMWHDHDIDFARWLQPAAFWALIGPDLTNSSTCGLGKESKKKKTRKKDSGKLAIRPDHPRRRTEVKVCMPGGLRCVVLYFKFY